MKLQPVIIEWYDAHGGDEGWEPVKEIVSKGQRRVKSCGFLVPNKIDGYTTLILNYDKDTKSVGGYIHIPTSTIIEITELS